MSKKVCLLIDSLSSGGAEKMVANLSQSLSDIGFDIRIVIMQDDVKYPYKGKLYNFGKVKSKYSKLRAFWLFRKYFKNQKFDVIIDHRVRVFWLKEFLFSQLIFRRFKIIYCVHHYNLSLYFPLISIPVLAKQVLIKNSKIIAVSKEIKTEIKNQLSLDSDVIYNYSTEFSINKISMDYEYIIGVGRLEKVKQFNLLIEAYNKSSLPSRNIKLLIFGEGTQSHSLNRLIVRNELQDYVILKGFDINVGSYIKSAKALVMTSKSEGFPMVLIEAIKLKTPVISFDFKSGPSEIIIDEVNGLLINNQDKDALVDALNKLIDVSFYKNLKLSLEKYNSPFTEEKIIKDWLKLIN